LRGSLLRPAGGGPFAAIVYNHGSEEDPSLEFLGDLGLWFQKRGFVVLFPFRRGASGSEGQHWEKVVKMRPEAERDLATVEQLDAQSDDVLAGIAFVRAQPYVDSRYVAVLGCSFGGIETVLAAERSADVYAAVDFAGASYTWSKSAPLRERLVASVRNARVPVFFVQASNDFDTTPTLTLSAELADAGKPSLAKIFPPHGRTTMMGHAHFCNHAMDEWGSDVLAFLRDTATRPRR
jgi:dienelactone hydrolase